MKTYYFVEQKIFDDLSVKTRRGIIRAENCPNDFSKESATCDTYRNYFTSKSAADKFYAANNI